MVVDYSVHPKHVAAWQQWWFVPVMALCAGFGCMTLLGLL